MSDPVPTPEESDDEAPSVPVARRAPRRPDGRGVGLAVFSALVLGTVVGDGLLRARRDREERARTHARLEALKDFLQAITGEGFVPPETGPEGVGLEVVAATIEAWGMAPVVWKDGRIVVDNGPASFAVEVKDERGHPFRFRRPGRLFPKGWEVAAGKSGAGEDVVGADLAPVASGD